MALAHTVQDRSTAGSKRHEPTSKGCQDRLLSAEVPDRSPLKQPDQHRSLRTGPPGLKERLDLDELMEQEDEPGLGNGVLVSQPVPRFPGNSRPWLRNSLQSMVSLISRSGMAGKQNSKDGCLWQVKPLCSKSKVRGTHRSLQRRAGGSLIPDGRWWALHTIRPCQAITIQSISYASGVPGPARFNFQVFDAGDYTRLGRQTFSENISVLYPNDNTLRTNSASSRVLLCCVPP